MKGRCYFGGGRKSNIYIREQNSFKKKNSRGRRSSGGDTRYMSSNKLTALCQPVVIAARASRLPMESKQAAATAVLYHYPCPDGAFAALAAHLYFSATAYAHQTLFFPNTVYNPIRADQLPLVDIGDLYLLDFVGPKDFVREISPGVGGRVIVLDHHKTALEMLGDEQGESGGTQSNVVTVIDMFRSGATIAYDYFKQKLEAESLDDNHRSTITREFERLRKHFQYVEDADLWKWNLPDSKAFHNGLKDQNIEFDINLNPTLFDQLRSLNLQSMIDQGIKSASEKEILINEALQGSFEVALGGGLSGTCLGVEVNESISLLRSELGHRLACKSGNMGFRRIGAVVYQVPDIKDDGMLKVSLRSEGVEEDTTKISERYGGGGHRNASSFLLRKEEFHSWKVVRITQD